MDNIEKPGRIFKYTNIENAKKILLANTLKFSPPCSFNDPFDCDVNLVDFKFEQPLNNRVVIEIDALKKEFGDHPSFSIYKDHPLFWEQVYKGTQQDKINSSRICCFSLLNDNQLMWPHYADKHKGVCFEFDNLLENRFIDLSDDDDITEGEVGYEAKQRINYFREERQTAIYKLFFTKAEEWRYEKEYRMIILNDKSEFQPFNKSFLKSIYFGLNANVDNIQQIMNLCSYKEYQNLTFYHTIKNRFSLEFVERDW